MTKKQKVKNLLLNGKSITGKSAMKFGLYRLSSAIHILRTKDKLNIETTMITKKDVTFAKYKLVKK